MGSFERYQFRVVGSSKGFDGVVVASLLGSIVSTIIATSSIFIVFYLASPAFIEGRFDPGDWFVIWGYFGSIAMASGYLGRLWLTLQESIAGMDRVFQILDAPVENLEETKDAEATASDLTMRQGLALTSVAYDYPDGTAALRDIDFAGELGEMVALVGPTGAGKSTLAYLLPGLLTPTGGQYRLDGRLLEEDDLVPLRRQVAFVFQETSVFDDTVEGNIRMGRLDATPGEIRDAAALASAQEFIEGLPEKYQTRLGRSGSKLSVGQKQRVAIARALVSRKPLLILDEPTAALDPQTENRLVANLREARAGRLVVIIAHRLSTIRSADRIYFLEEGRIVESGTHQELLEIGGLYAKLSRIQNTTFIEESFEKLEA